MTRKIIFASVLGLCALSSNAQLNSSVSVEGEYEPLVIETERLSVFPQGYKFELPATNLSYDLNGIVTDFRPGLLTMGVTGRNTDWYPGKRRGFIDFRLGSYLNSALHAGVYALSESRQSLLAELKFQSSSLFRMHGVPDTYTHPSRKRFYNGSIGLRYFRLIGEEGILNACARYRAGYFNYYGTTIEKALIPIGAGNPKTPTQTINQVMASVNYSSSPSTIRGWHAGGDVSFTGYRRFYFPVIENKSHGGDKETVLKLDAGYAFNFADFSALAIDADGHFLFYPDNLSWISQLTTSEPDEGNLGSRKNYGIVSLKPSYRFANELFSMRAGVKMDISYDAMGRQPSEKFGAFHIAPDVTVDYRSRSGVGISLSATGGVIPSSLLMKEEFDRYQLPIILSTLPVYSPIDARIGINAGPFSGFSGSFSFRYAAAKNTPLGGWYQAYLGAWLPGANQVFAMQDNLYLNPYLQTINLHGYSLDLQLNYSYGTIVELGFNGTYTPQKGRKGIFNGYDRARWVLNASAGVRPIKQLKVELGYDYRGVRNCYRMSAVNSEYAPVSYRLPDITDLNAKITYSLSDKFDIYCKGENLLNRRVDLLPGLQSEGMVISGGLYFEF